MKIGFIDYYLDEYHANHYPQWIKNAAGDVCAFYAWAQTDSPKGGLTTAAWCEKYGAVRCGSIEEVCRICDFLIILSPDNPEYHLSYAERVFPFAKPVFMDKTFAPDTDTALKITELAKRCNTPLFSSSSLRFCSEFEGIERADSALTFGTGHNFEIEVIHPVEICVRLMGTGARAVEVYGDKTRFTAHLFYTDGRTAEIFYCQGCKGIGYGALIERDGARELIQVKSDFFQLLTNAVISFFKSGIPPVLPDGILEGIKIRDGIIKALEKGGRTEL